MLCALIGASPPAAAIDLDDPDNVSLAWAPAAGNVAGYIVFGRVNSGPTQVLGFSVAPQIDLTGLGLSLGDDLLVTVQAFGAAYDRGPMSPPSDQIFFRTSLAWQPVPDQNLRVGDSIAVPLAASSSSGVPPRLTSPDMFPFLRIDDFGDGTGWLVLEPQAGDEGFYTIRLNASNPAVPNQRATVTISVTIAPYSPTPAMIHVADQSTSEGQTLRIDVDAPVPVLVTGRNLPPFVSIVNAGGSSQIIASPGYNHAGVYPITLDASEIANPTRVGSDSFTLTVLNTNRAPVLSTPGSLRVEPGVAFQLELSALDPDGDPLLFAVNIGGTVAAVRPLGAPNTASLRIPASYTQSGAFNLQAVVFDGGSPTLGDFETVSVTVAAGAAATPVMLPLADVAVLEGGGTVIDVQTSNAAQASFSLSATGLPPFASFHDSKDGSGQLVIAPAWGDRGSFDVTLTATNTTYPQLRASQTLHVDVGEVRVVVSHATRNELRVIDPGTGTEQAIAGNLHPIALTASADGRVFALRGILNSAPAGVFEINLSASTARTVTTHGLLAAAGHGPRSITMGSDGLLYVSVAEQTVAGLTARIVSVDPDSGQQSLVLSGAPLTYPASITAGPGGLLYVGDTAARAIIEIDTTTGTGRKIASVPYPQSIALHDSGRLIVSSEAGSVGTGSLWSFDLETGALEPLSVGGSLGTVSGVAVQAGGALTTVDRNVPGITRVDPQTGAQQAWPLSGAGFSGVVVVPAP